MTSTAAQSPAPGVPVTRSPNAPVVRPRDSPTDIRGIPARAVLEALPVGVLVATAEGDWANPELLRIWDRAGTVRARAFGRTLEPVGDRRPRSHARPRPPRARPRSPVALALAGQPVPAGRYRLKRDSGGYAVVQLSATPLTDPDGRVTGALIVAADETATYERERFRDAFLGILGHELRSPITSMVGGAELLRDDVLEPDTRAEVSASLVEESHRLNDLIDQLIQLASLERRPRASLEPVHVVHTARRVIRRERHRLPRLDVRVVAGPHVPPVLGDEGFVAQVVTILVDNAAKYGGTGGRVTVEVAQNGREVEVHVIDQGPGLPTEGREALFGLYHRGRPGEIPDRPGTGIGLFVARAVVEAMGGRVWAENRKEGGADVGFALGALTR